MNSMAQEATKGNVLLVDDEEALRKGVRRLLEIEGYSVEEAPNGTQGIEKGTEKDFDLAILDLKMPDFSGIDVLKAIREAQPNTICFIATAFASYETAVKATKLGAYGYILKPFTDDELLHHLDQGIEKRRLKLEADKLRIERENRLLEVAFERSRLNTIINVLADGVVVINNDNNVVYYNPAALKFLNVDEIQIEEESSDCLPADVVDLVKEYIDGGKSDAKSTSVQVEFEQPKQFLEVTCSPVPHPDGSLAGVVIVLKNITRFKEIELLKSQFVSMVSHELKAPMAATIGFLNILNDGKVNLPPEKQKEFLDRSVNRLQALLTMVNDLLDISRMELKTVRRDLIELNLRDIVEDVLGLFDMEIKKKKLSVSLDNNTILPPLYADKDEITRLITNLISNAIKYNVEQGTITIDFSISGEFLLTSVKDTGIGMKAEEKKKLFSEFFRAKNEKTKGIHGTGLGISIVKRIVDSYQGKIEVETEYEKGTTFIVSLPYGKKQEEIELEHTVKQSD